MSNNSYRVYDRSHANELKIELAAQRTKRVQDEVQQILDDPAKMEFLAHLYVMWLREFGDAPGTHYEQQRANKAMLALDWAMQHFARDSYHIVKFDTERIKNAEIPVDLPHEWTAAPTTAGRNYTALPQSTWKYVFFHNGKPTAAFDDKEPMWHFFDYMKSKGIDVTTYNGMYHLTKKEQKATKPGRYFVSYGDGFHPRVYKISDNGETASPVNRIIPMVPRDLEESMCKRAVAMMNSFVDEAEEYWKKYKEENK
jgi:hypothetical protein